MRERERESGGEFGEDGDCECIDSFGVLQWILLLEEFRVLES